MHILIVTDQHPDSLGGAQISITLQRKYLERAGHTVSIAAPKRWGKTAAVTELNTGPRRGMNIDLPGIPITKDLDYGASWPGKATEQTLLRALRTLTPIDIVHVQGDFWGALLGYRVARSLGVPVVHTLHNNLDAGTRSVTKHADAVFWGLNLARRIALGATDPTHPGAPAVDAAESGAWKYLGELMRDADLVVAPSRHFADLLERVGIPGPIVVIPTGVDDDEVQELLSDPRTADGADSDDADSDDSVQLVWIGRMSPEKRIVELLHAFAQVEPAALTVVGAGLQLTEVKALASRLGVSDRVTFTGPLSHREALSAIRAADVLVQTSIGFETQGMTPYEATALGTPTVFSDPNIARELDVAPAWIVQGDTVEDLTRTLHRAVTEVAEAKRSGTPLRVPEMLGEEMLQSFRSAQMIELYEQVIA